MYPAIFLDRDGVLIENRADYVRDWSQVSILPKTIAALSNPYIKNYKIVIVTNQSAVGRNLVSIETARYINDQLVDTIKKNGGWVDSIYMCPHKPEDQCSCRKPQPGLLLQAAKELSLNLNASWVIGDAWSDLLAGQAAGARSIVMLKTGRGEEQLQQPPPKGLVKNYLIFNDLQEALLGIFRFDKEQK